VGPTLEQARHVIALMPGQSPIERRDRALIAFTLLTGARDSAIASMKLKHVNLIAGCVDQDAREVKTKFSKTFTTYFFPVGEDIRQIVADWVTFLRSRCCGAMTIRCSRRRASGWVRRGSSRPSGWNGRTGAAPRASARSSATHSPVPGCRTSTRTASETRLVRLGQAVCQTPEEFKAWSQNLGHEKVLTTFLSYGQVESPAQGQIIRGLGGPQVAAQPDVSELAKAVVREMRATIRD
jgi:hypothetical protein